MQPALAVLESAAYETASNYSFTLVPLFILMGNLISESGMARDSLPRVPGVCHADGTADWQRPALTASAAFSTVSGSSLATATTMTRVAYPEMMAQGYDKRLAAGSLAAGGTLGIMIPPSIALLLYALITEQSVGEMFLAGILPGLFSLRPLHADDPRHGALLARRAARGHRGTAGAARVRRSSASCPPSACSVWSWAGLYGGFFTPTEAGGVGAFFALVYALWKGLDLKGFINALRMTVETTAVIFLILIGAEVFGFVLSVSQVSFSLVALHQRDRARAVADHGNHPALLRRHGLLHGEPGDDPPDGAHLLSGHHGGGLRPGLVRHHRRRHRRAGPDHARRSA